MVEILFIALVLFVGVQVALVVFGFAGLRRLPVRVIDPIMKRLPLLDGHVDPWPVARVINFAVRCASPIAYGTAGGGVLLYLLQAGVPILTSHGFTVAYLAVMVGVACVIPLAVLAFLAVPVGIMILFGLEGDDDGGDEDEDPDDPTGPRGGRRLPRRLIPRVRGHGGPPTASPSRTRKPIRRRTTVPRASRRTR